MQFGGQPGSHRFQLFLCGGCLAQFFRQFLKAHFQLGLVFELGLAFHPGGRKLLQEFFLRLAEAHHFVVKVSLAGWCDLSAGGLSGFELLPAGALLFELGAYRLQLDLVVVNAGREFLPLPLLRFQCSPQRVGFRGEFMQLGLQTGQ